MCIRDSNNAFENNSADYVNNEVTEGNHEAFLFLVLHALTFLSLSLIHI